MVGEITVRASGKNSRALRNTIHRQLDRLKKQIVNVQSIRVDARPSGKLWTVEIGTELTSGDAWEGVAVVDSWQKGFQLLVERLRKFAHSRDAGRQPRKRLSDFFPEFSGAEAAPEEASDFWP